MLSRFASNKSFIPIIIVAKVMGIYNINEKSKAVSLFRFLNIPPTIVDPLLLIPGRSATTWNRPITRASLKVISFSFFLPLKSLIKNKNKAVINKVRPTNFIFFSRKIYWVY